MQDTACIMEHQEREELRSLFRALTGRLEEGSPSPAPDGQLTHSWSRLLAPGGGGLLPALSRLCGLGDFDCFCLCLALCCELDGGLRNRLQEHTGSPVPSFDMAGGLYGLLGLPLPPGEAMRAADAGRSPLRPLLRMEQGVQEGLPQLLRPMLPRSNLLLRAAGARPGPGRLWRLDDGPPPGTLPLFEPVARELLALWETARPLVLLTGRPGSGKRTLVRRAAALAGRPCLSLSLDGLEALDAGERAGLWWEIILEASLENALVCLDGYTPAWEAGLTLLGEELPAGLPLALLGREPACPPPRLGPRVALRRELGSLSREDYALMQCSLSGQYGRPQGEEWGYYPLTPGQLAAAWSESSVRAAAQGGREICSKDFSAAVAAQGPSSPLASPVLTNARLEDLVAAPETMAQLDALEAFIRAHRAGRLPQGRGVTALFYGPSGTGKTMAASALAGLMGLELLRLDLSRIMDKYIGETEKHLAQVLAQARERGCILFFDEADALFSRRTQVTSSHDRYANLSTSYLLQSIEEFDGVALLATNLFKNFDEAFLRRMDLLVRFSLPDEPLRRRLWQAAFPPGAVLEEGVDPARLAREQELSPATICAAARTAAVLAWAEASPVTRDHLSRALRNELAKYGKTLGEDFLA